MFGGRTYPGSLGCRVGAQFVGVLLRLDEEDFGLLQIVVGRFPGPLNFSGGRFPQSRHLAAGLGQQAGSASQRPPPLGSSLVDAIASRFLATRCLPTHAGIGSRQQLRSRLGHQRRGLLAVVLGSLADAGGISFSRGPHLRRPGLRVEHGRRDLLTIVAGGLS